MNVTRDVIYDLLPAYFAGEASADTCALIEEFFTTDPEFGRMAARFRTLYAEMHGDIHSAAGNSADTTFSDVQRFASVRTRVERRQTANGLGLGYLIAALFALLIALVRDPGNLRNPGYIIATVFAVVALFSFASGRLMMQGAPTGIGVPLGGRGYRRRPWRA